MPQDVRYTAEEVDRFWATVGSEVRSFIKEKAVCCQSTSIDALWERTREKALRTARKPFDNRGKEDEVSALTAQNLDELDKLIAKKIATTSVLEEAHSTDQRTSKRAGRALCDFFVGFQGYCQAYSGVVQLMGGLDQSFVTGALQVLGLFMVVAVNKSETEIRIHSMIKTLTSEYARIRKIVGIYSNSSTLRERVATVYQLGIECLREATVYYSYGSWRRLWHVVSSPPEIDLDAKISDLRSAINELNEERDVEAHSRLNRVEEKVDVSFEQSNLERLDARLEIIRSLLGLSPVNASTQLRDLASSLEIDFSHLRRIPPFRAEDLTSNTSFKDWLDAALVESSTFLLIQGRTVAPHDSNLAWVSQATVEAVRRLKERKAISACHLCKQEGIHESNYGDIHPVPTAAVVLASLGYQLLGKLSQGRTVILAGSSSPNSESHMRDLLDKAQSFRSMIEARKARKKHVSTKDCSNVAMGFLRASIALIAQNLLFFLPDSRRVVFYLIVDRIDSLAQHDTLLLEPLMDLTQRPEAGTAVKVLVVGERRLGRDSEISEFVANHQHTFAWGAIDLDQGS